VTAVNAAPVCGCYIPTHSLRNQVR